MSLLRPINLLRKGVYTVAFGAWKSRGKSKRLPHKEAGNALEIKDPQEARSRKKSSDLWNSRGRKSGKPWEPESSNATIKGQETNVADNEIWQGRD